MPAVKVFIGGSRAVARLNDALRKRLDRIIAEHHEVLIGDANGADRIVQQYLADHQYRAVTVYCTGSRCRNNVGQWTTNAIAPPASVRGGFDFYAARDRKMAANP
jgi:adenine-specific DNA-methyltransferase